MTTVLEGLSALGSWEVVVCMLLGLGLGLLVGAFPGVTATMAVALASGFTMTLDPVPGLCVLLTIYVAANFGDRIPAILINTPGTPASIATTLDGYPMAKKGQAGIALTLSALVSAAAILVSMVIFAVVAVPVATIARDYFRSPELFALVVFGLTVMIGIASKSVIKGMIAGVLGLLLGSVGLYSATGDQRFTFGIPQLSGDEGVPFIAVIIGLFGVAELFDQMLTHRAHGAKPVSALGRWWPNRSELRGSVKPFSISAVVGLITGLVPAAGGDIAGLIGWDRAKRASKTGATYGKGNYEGVVASDTASSATLGGSLTTTMALGIPGDSVMAVMIGSMLVWGLNPGPGLFTSRPDLVVTMTGIMVLAVVISLAASLLRLKGMVKLLDTPNHYLWPVILLFCMVGTYATTNDIFTVIVMLVAGVAGVIFKRLQIPAGPIVLGLLLGPIAEENLARALVLQQGGFFHAWSPVAIAFLALALISLLLPLLRKKSAGALPEPMTEADAGSADHDAEQPGPRNTRS
jgi:putative tricarboxylic transport membrane protein